MMLIKMILCLLVLLGAPFIHQESLSALDIGGKMEFRGGLSYNDELNALFSGTSELEFYLPSSRDVDLRLVLEANLNSNTAPEPEPEPELGITYAYIRYHTDNGHITVGRQPVSWSYGAMFNPLDYGTSVDGFAGMSLTPKADGFRVFRSMGDRSSLQGVISFQELSSSISYGDISYGARLRTPIPGHDISTQVIYSNSLLRAGATYSGDLGPVGIYGAAGYLYQTDDEEQDIVIQGGIDYSFQVGPEYEEKLVYLQAEYLRFLLKNLGNTAITHPDLALLFQHDALIAAATIEVDYFSSAGIAVITETSDWVTVVSPFYETELGGGLELRLDAAVARLTGNDFNYTAGIQLSYYF